jgi:small-conductance mechanosensitive channel/CRP-like cAMP-binding protein
VITSELIVGGASLAVALLARGFTANRLIHSKLRLAIAALGGSLAATLFLALAVPPAGSALPAQIESVRNLLLALGLVSLVVVLLINPWRVDRVPERFPNIVQDAIIIGIFAVVATALMKEKFLTTSAVGAVVIGFALQDTLGNMFAGLALQVERPFAVGHWIKVGGHEGRVTGITWRATQLRTKSGDSVVLPNNVISKEPIVNFSEPEMATALTVDVGASYDAAPNRVKGVILEALADAALILKSPPPEVRVADFASSSITYRVKFWVADYSVDEPARDQARVAIYYAFKRSGIEIPFPIQVEYRRETAVVGLSAVERARYLESADLFAMLPDEERARFAELSTDRLFGAGQTIVRQGQDGDSMFVVGQGRVRVTVGESGAEVATLGPGAYFGEMSLLTGDPRSATVSAIDDSLLLEITASDFRRIALAHPEVVVKISEAVERRRSGLEETKRAATAAPAAEGAPRSFLARVQQFLRLPVSRT